MSAERRYGAGDTVFDLCRACKSERRHTIIVADPAGRPLRVACDYCGSQHNYRGGEAGPSGSASSSGSSTPRGTPARDSFPLATERERREPPMAIEVKDGSVADLETLLRRVFREECGVTPVAPADRWRGGEMVLRPGRPGVADKTWPIETVFQKIVAIRNRLRVLEQQVNAAEELSSEAKLKLQGYITGCYGSLTSFNVLFADDEDRFKGSGE
ncbi:MAG: hypothetical protein MUE47_02350 [Acidobacteria bacterium]|nr:hypothetical protein [Acidobacteriota bacterium]